MNLSQIKITNWRWLQKVQAMLKKWLTPSPTMPHHLYCILFRLVPTSQMRWAKSPSEMCDLHSTLVSWKSPCQRFGGSYCYLLWFHHCYLALCSIKFPRKIKCHVALITYHQVYDMIFLLTFCQLSASCETEMAWTIALLFNSANLPKTIHLWNDWFYTRSTLRALQL